MEIKPIKRTKLNDEVFQQLKELLINGTWKQGEKLPSENELTEQFGVSRITIRQALQRLAALGWIETKTGKGSFVCAPDVGNVMEQLTPLVYLDENAIYQANEFREMLDTWSAKLAALRADDADVEALRDNYRSMKACSEEGDWQKFAQLDLKFHVMVGEITKNQLICKTYHILNDAIQTSVYQMVERMGFLALKFHLQLIEAIAAHDEKEAERIARIHVENNRKYIAKGKN
ncbi:MAG: FadR/GntR family transcriptional regulator [Lachnospiraceae bacterium]|jgi:GntR family transcriptional repressor for pyruvate dehydrogenase complex